MITGLLMLLFLFLVIVGMALWIELVENKERRRANRVKKESSKPLDETTT